MTSYLVATASVHVTASAADYLAGRLEPSDTVVVVGVREPEAPARDVEDAGNVARARLGAAAPTVEIRDGDPVPALLDAVDQHDPDVIVMGATSGTEGSTGVGSTTSEVLARVDRPVVVVPTDLGVRGGH